MARNHRVSFAVSRRLPSERDGAPHDRLMALRDQVIRSKASQTVLLHQTGELKARGYPDLIAGLQKEIDLIDRRIQQFETEIQALETRLFGK